MKRRGGLGKILLRSLKSERSPVRKHSKKTRNILRISRFKTRDIPGAEEALPPVILAPPKLEVPQPAELPKPEIKPDLPELAELPELPELKEVQVLPVLAPPQQLELLNSQGQSLSTENLIRPNDQLK